MDFLSLDDDYEEEAYGFITGLQICEHFDCRDPRRGPFVEQEDGQLFCGMCDWTFTLGQDPMDYDEMDYQSLQKGDEEDG